MDVQFRHVLKIWWTYALADFFRSLAALLATAYDSKFFGWLYQVLIINDFLGILAILILHSYRFQYSGQVCSGDFVAVDTGSMNGYLILRGKLLTGLVIYTWVGLFTYCSLLACLITAASRREPEYTAIHRTRSATAAKDGEESQALKEDHKPYEMEIQTIIAACSAASSGHLKILERFYNIGISMDEGDYDKRTPLHVAASAGQIQIVQYLISKKVNVNPKDRWGSTPLNDAKKPEIRQLLLQNGGVLGVQSSYKPIKLQNLTDEDYRLFYAAFKGDVKEMQIMKIKGWKVNAYDYDGRTALGIAASEGNQSAVQFLVENGASLTHQDARGNNALADAVREKRTQVAEYLRSHMKA